jgi:hypothetical protein
MARLTMEAVSVVVGTALCPFAASERLAGWQRRRVSEQLAIENSEMRVRSSFSTPSHQTKHVYRYS